MFTKRPVPHNTDESHKYHIKGKKPGIKEKILHVVGRILRCPCKTPETWCIHTFHELFSQIRI